MWCSYESDNCEGGPVIGTTLGRSSKGFMLLALCSPPVAPPEHPQAHAECPNGSGAPRRIGFMMGDES